MADLSHFSAGTRGRQEEHPGDLGAHGAEGPGSTMQTGIIAPAPKWLEEIVRAASIGNLATLRTCAVRNHTLGLSPLENDDPIILEDASEERLAQLWIPPDGLVDEKVRDSIP